ncbi:tetratricopeptide repeat protein 23 isoform X2 [Mastacembelus armatus]|uniref:tetratricopeptide repeat protein 23 isoform X2 n=1 Tax=Mastacembelus armatus TaxID=205130 RepID=UPI000E45C355|nr:tetratricopeptide repeat protein 23-like isoform X2 [Mastacembelus armatus]
MDDKHTLRNTRPNSFDSPTESPENMTSTNRRLDASPCGSEMSSLSQTQYAKKKLIMIPPEEKLKLFDSRAQAHENNQEFDACIQDLVRCVALTRLVYGEGHLKLAQAHARLAKAYFQFKGWGMQAQKHSTQARELLPFGSSSFHHGDEKLEVLTTLLCTHLTQGGAGLLTDKYPWVYKRQNRSEEALSQCEQSLQLLKNCDKPEKTCSVYRDMSMIEQEKGDLDRAIEHLSKAHAIAMSHSSEELEGAQISHSLALILSAAAEPHRSESAGHYFEQSLSAYKNCVGVQDPAFLAAQDDFCRFLLLNDQQERCIEIQRASLTSKRSTFGDLSAEVADTLQLIGSVEMTEGRMKQAHSTMTKCLEIQNLLYGPQHKKTKATQKAVDMLARAPDVAVAKRQQKPGRRKTTS